MYSCLYVRSGSGGGGDGDVSTRNAALFGHVSFSGSTWLHEPASRIGFLMASGGAYICTVRSHLASREYVHSLRRKFATLALRTCREASRATRKFFIFSQSTVHVLKIHYKCACAMHIQRKSYQLGYIWS